MSFILCERNNTSPVSLINELEATKANNPAALFAERERQVESKIVISKQTTKKSEPNRKAHATVLQLEKLTEDIKLVTLLVNKKQVHFQAGQFIAVYDGRANIHPSIFPGTYSIASPPSDLPFIKFAVGEDHNPRNLRNFLYFHAKPGHPLLLDTWGSGTVAVSPRMVMTPVGGPGGLMLIGGGLAVMGLVSIVEELLQDERDGKNLPSIQLFHSNRSNTNVPFYERMQQLEEQNDNFKYHLHVTGKVEPQDKPRGVQGRIDMETLAKQIPGVRLFCLCGSGVFCEAIVNMLLNLGVWPGSIRTDYTTRVDPSRRLNKIKECLNASSSSGQEGSSSKSKRTPFTAVVNEDSIDLNKTSRFDMCADATQDKGSMAKSGDEYLRAYGVDVLLEKITKELIEESPEYPLQFLTERIQEAQAKLPEVSNINAADPEFWVNYWETDTVTWQAPVVSPWLERHLERFVGKKKRSIFIPLCGKSLDMKLLLEKGHRVIGAECSGIACADFFTENNIPDYVVENVDHPTGKRIVRHRSTSLPIELYEGDIFDLTPEIVGKIDRVLDRAALVALHPSMIEEKYLPLMIKLLKPGGKMLFASVSELPFPKAPPHAHERQQIEGILSKFFSKIRMLETHRYRVNAGHVSEPIYMLTSNKPSS